jgi:hypothetical protein
MSFSLARSWRAFVLAKEDRRGANKNEITIFVFSITAKDFSHGVLLDGKKGEPLRVVSLTSALGGVNSVFGNWCGSPKAEVFAAKRALLLILFGVAVDRAPGAA